MKKICCLLFIIIIGKAAFGQAYIVTYLKGNVFHNNKPIKLHDKLDGAAQITSNDKTAELALFSAQRGKLRLTFAGSKAIVAKAGTKKSEFYQLLVADYLQSYTAEKTLTTRRAFKLENFFNYTDAEHGGNKVFLVEGQQLPLTGHFDKFFICRVNGKDTLCGPVKISGRFLVFDDETIKGLVGAGMQNAVPASCLIKQGRAFNGKYIEVYFDEPVEITLINSDELKSLVNTFSGGLSTYYHGDKAKLIADVEEQLAYYYGYCYEPGVTKVLLDLLK